MNFATPQKYVHPKLMLIKASYHTIIRSLQMNERIIWELHVFKTSQNLALERLFQKSAFSCGTQRPEIKMNLCCSV